ncbi:MAG: hypothetical protein ACTS3T_20850 [Almyronema sp.]
MTFFKPFNPSELQSEESRCGVRETLASAQADHAEALEDENVGVDSETTEQLASEATEADQDLATKFAASLGQNGG